MSAALPLNSPRALRLVKTTCMALTTLFWAGLGLNSAAAQITLYNYVSASDGSDVPVSGLNGTNLLRGPGVQDTVLGCTGLTQGFGADAWPTTNTFNVDAFNTSG